MGVYAAYECHPANNNNNNRGQERTPILLHNATSVEFEKAKKSRKRLFENCKSLITSKLLRRHLMSSLNRSPPFSVETLMDIRLIIVARHFIRHFRRVILCHIKTSIKKKKNSSHETCRIHSRHSVISKNIYGGKADKREQ